MKLQLRLDTAYIKTNFKHYKNLNELRREFPNMGYTTNTEGEITGLILYQQKTLENLTLAVDLSALMYLNITENEKLQAITFAGTYAALAHLDLSDNRLTTLDIPADIAQLAWLDASRNRLEQVAFSGNLPRLEYLDFSENQLVNLDLPLGLSQLKYLYLRDNQVQKLNLPNTLEFLEILHLKNNQLADFSKQSLNRLPNDVFLNLYNNPLPDTMVSNIENDKNVLPFLKDYYYKDMKLGSAIDNHYKILVIGNGSVGKSSLVDRLVKNEFFEIRDSTHAIRLVQYQKEGFPYILKIWDFGGQAIYHTTHRLFMQSNAIYLALWEFDTEKDLQGRSKTIQVSKQLSDVKHPLTYWLHYAKYFGKNSPLLVVQTRKFIAKGEQDCPQKQELKSIAGTNFLKFLAVDSKATEEENNGFDELKFQLQKAIRSLGRSQKKPIGWLAVRQKIWEQTAAIQAARINKSAAIPEPTMSIKDFEKMVYHPDHAVSNAQYILNWLKETGAIYYQKGLFGDKIILDQEWAIRAIYTIFDRTATNYLKFENQGGQFTGQELANIWQTANYSKEEQQVFINFMLSCELCFELKNKDEAKEDKWLPLLKRTYLAPQILKKERPKSFDITLRQWRKIKNQKQMYVRYRFPFMHYGVLQSFIVRTHPLANVEDIWRRGILLEWEEEDAIVEAVNNDIIIHTLESGRFLLFKIMDLIKKLANDNVQESFSWDNVFYLDKTELEQAKQEVIYQKDGTKIVLKDYQIFLNQTQEGQQKSELAIAPQQSGRIDKKQSTFPIEPKAPEQLKVLYLTAHPPSPHAALKIPKINWEKETAGIEKYGAGIDLEIVETITKSDMFRQLKKHAPHILHLSLHGLLQDEDIGIKEAGLACNNEDKNGLDILTADQLCRTIQRIQRKNKHLTVVLLNACFSHRIAQKVSKLGLYAIGNTEELQYKAARKFSEGFYEEYQHSSIEEAVENGIAMAEMDDEDVTKSIKLYYMGILVELD